jgi:hypothetical protein
VLKVVLQVLKVLEDPQVHSDLKVLKVLRDHEDHRVQQGLRVLLGLDLQDSLVLKELVDLKELKGQQEVHLVV